MDIVALEKDSSETGIISAEDVVSVFTLPRFDKKDTWVSVKVKYSDKNWLLIRDMYAFCDNEVRDVVVEVDEWRVGDNTISVLGFVMDEDLNSVKEKLEIKSPSKALMEKR